MFATAVEKTKPPLENLNIRAIDPIITEAEVDRITEQVQKMVKGIIDRMEEQDEEELLLLL